MKKKSLSNLVHTSLLVLIGASANATAEPTVEEEALNFVCETLEVDCSNVPVPEVMYADITALIGAVGYYDRNRYPFIVWMDLSYKGWLGGQNHSTATLIHEITHYVDAVLGITDYTSCNTENLAYVVEDVWLSENLPAEVHGDGWEVVYGCSFNSVE